MVGDDVDWTQILLVLWKIGFSFILVIKKIDIVYKIKIKNHQNAKSILFLNHLVLALMSL